MRFNVALNGQHEIVEVYEASSEEEAVDAKDAASGYGNISEIAGMFGLSDGDVRRMFRANEVEEAFVQPGRRGR